MTQLALGWTLARRELRGGLRGFRIFLATLAIGVAAIAGVGSLSDAVKAGLHRDGRALLGGDVSLSLRHVPADADARAYLERTTARFSSVSELRAMARAVKGGDVRALVEVKAVDDVYPLAGTLTLSPPQSLAEALMRQDGVDGAAVDRGLLDKLNIRIGERIRIGDGVFAVRAVVEKEPDRVASVMSFGPRLLIHGGALARTGLVQPGSQIRYRYRVDLGPQPDTDSWRADLDAAFPQAAWRVRGTGDAAPGLKRFIDRLGLFLSFVGLTALLVGGVGVAGAVQTFLARKTATIATLKCLGAPTRVVFFTYFLQVMVLAGLGIVMGVVVGAAVPFAAAGLLASVLPSPPVAALYAAPLLIAAAFGGLIAVTFALWPLLRARRVPASALFRDRIAPSLSSVDRLGLLAAVGGAAALAAFTVLTASDKGFALWFIGVAAALLGLLHGGAGVLVHVARRWGRAPSTSRRPLLRLALANLHRPDAPTAQVVVSLGIGLSVLVAVALIQNNLAAQVDERLPDAAPAFFFIDVQPHQVAAFEKTVLAVPETSDLQRMPSLRGRIIAVNATPVEDMTIPPGSQWAVQGDRALTYAARVPDHAKLVAGEWWPEDYAGPPLISFDAGLARAFDVGVGDTLTLNILGRSVTATIGSLRTIDWRSLRFDFAIIFAPGALDDAPHTHIAAIQAPQSRESKIERVVSDAFPNVSAIRVRDALDAASHILSGVGQAVRGTAAIAIIAGMLVLGGAVAAGAERRTRDAVIFKVIGASRSQLLRAFLMEYGVLGAATGLIAATVGSLIGWAVVVHLLKLDWAFSPATVTLAVVLALAVALAAGYAGTARALRKKAAPYLRNA